ncbi:coiled-coil domain-containing protein 138-like [Xenia sp. Carnegie-2017]|uniref:coiled-coil domain-containing protein 138-like n=1 Tax=Xenia sp. Carnegie-2017 TaxID=2897299 RepID=UPI001F04C239|nr:coiled-coil domain-containing protein 138-like [Xenia sp. Carnegie-2017]
MHSSDNRNEEQPEYEHAYFKFYADIPDKVNHNRHASSSRNVENLSHETCVESPSFINSMLLSSQKDKNSNKMFGKSELHKVYQELRVISQRLKNETHQLQLWEKELCEREAILKDHEDSSTQQDLILNERFEKELQAQCSIINEEYQDQIIQLQKVIQEKSKEANRLRDSFNTIRSTHEELRKEFVKVKDQNRFLESQTLSLQQRLNNLVRKNEYEAKKQKEAKSDKMADGKVLLTEKNNNDTFLRMSSSSKLSVSGILDVLSCLFIWISDFQLDARKLTSELETPNEAVYGKCFKILPPLADLLSYLPAVNPNCVHPLLKFIYSVIFYMENSPQGTQKPLLLSTLRRIGEELYKPEITKLADNRTETKKRRNKAQIYIHSSNLEERMLSALIILKTLTQADYLSHTFDILKCDLREEQGKRLFLDDNGLQVILLFMKPKNKVLLEFAVDVMLQMSMDSVVVDDFLECCSTSVVFNVLSNLLNEKELELKILEKLSIILQRLSKIKNNRRFFEAFQLVPVLDEHLRQNDSENAFLSLNLRSVLVNLNIVKT